VKERNCEHNKVVKSNIIWLFSGKALKYLISKVAKASSVMGKNYERNKDYVETICQLKGLICYKNNLKDQFVTNVKFKGLCRNNLSA